MNGLVLAVDGGNVKTDLALLGADGEVLSLVRGGRSSPHYVGVDGCVNLLRGLLAAAGAAAGLGSDAPQVAVAQVLIAGADLPEELDALHVAVAGLGWGERLRVDNDTFALLRSGTDSGWGVAVVCGGGINCVGVAPDGRQVRFPSLGPITGDWGGGYDVGLAGLWAAARRADGRGPRTVLEGAVPAHFGMREPLDVARAIHLEQMAGERLGELARVVFAAAADDPVAGGILARLSGEIVAFARAALERLELTGQAPDIVLGGGLMRGAPLQALEAIRRDVAAVAPDARVTVAPAGPIVGAALLGLDELDAAPEAMARARAELAAAIGRIEVEGNGGEVLAVGRNGDLLGSGVHG